MMGFLTGLNKQTAQNIVKIYLPKSWCMYVFIDNKLICLGLKEIVIHFQAI